MQRVTITIDDELMSELDRIIATRGYQNRSEAIRDLARAGIREAAAGIDTQRDCVAALVYIYDHAARQLPKRLTETFHDHHELSLSSLHVHLDHDSCMEVTVLRGKTGQVQHFAEHVIAERGVRHGRVVVMPTDALAPRRAPGKTGSRRPRHRHGSRPRAGHGARNCALRTAALVGARPSPVADGRKRPDGLPYGIRISRCQTANASPPAEARARAPRIPPPLSWGQASLPRMTGSRAPRRRGVLARHPWRARGTPGAYEAPASPCEEDARLSALHRGDFRPWAALLAPGLSPGGRRASSSQPGRSARRAVPRAFRARGCKSPRGTPLPAPPTGLPLEGARHERG